MEETQKLPDFVLDRVGRRSEVDDKRASLRAFVRLGQSLVDVDVPGDPCEAYRDHLLWKHRPGERA